MPRIAYTEKKFRADALEIIGTANAILEDFASQGYEVTLRQLYYQFVAKDLIPNSDQSYKRLGNIVSDARMAGYIDWNHLIDRGRFVRSLATWDDPSDIISASASQFRTDWWDDQDEYVEVWIEKDALVGVIERPCNRYRVPFFSCRGYTSSSAMWSAAQRIGRKIDAGKNVTILHLGDHDPSGIDMSRDIYDRIDNFIYGDGRDVSQFELRRIALSMAQVNEYGPPPNPAKITDSRARDYIAKFGRSSWELDALSPTTLDDLISTNIDNLIDDEAWDAAKTVEDEHKRKLAVVSDDWHNLTEDL